MLFAILVILIIAAGVVLLVLSGRGKSRSWLQFYAKGKDAGFSIKEIELLRRLAVKSSLEDPGSLFWSQNQLDVCIRSLVRSMHLGGSDNDQGGQDFLSKLYDFRKKIEMNKPRIKNGISNSRQINDGQALRILVSG
ncbi:MAG: PilZ domain-containing protein, partial [Treponema sp.]|nr:PilZ domain-containing protein [Treponema sp.]